MEEPRFETWDAEELLEEIREVAAALEKADDLPYFCSWLAERWGVDIRE